MKTKITILMMAVALFTNVMAQDEWNGFDIVFQDYFDDIVAQGLPIDLLNAGNNMSAVATYTLPDYVPLTLGEYTFIYATNFYRETGGGFLSECGITFEYGAQIKNNANNTPPASTESYVEFPELPNVCKLTVYGYSNNNTADIRLFLQKKEGDTWSDPLDEGYLYTQGTSSNKDQMYEFEYATNTPVTLRLNRDDNTNYMGRIFRIVVEKYDSGTNTVISSSMGEKISLSVSGKTLSLSKAVSNANLSIFDLAGKLVLNSSINSDKFDLQNLNAGVYIVKLIAEQGEMTRKVVVK